MEKNTQIINHLKKEIYDLQTYVEEIEITLGYSIRNSLIKEKKQNDFYYKGESEKEINELMKKSQIEIFEILAHKHLEKNVGYGEKPKQFQTPCYDCNQKTLTTLGWSEEGYPDNLERFFCRLCRTSFGWIDIKDDPVELQQEMAQYYQVFTEKDIKKTKQKMTQLNKEMIKVNEHLSNKRKLLEKLKGYVIPIQPHQ